MPACAVTRPLSRSLAIALLLGLLPRAAAAQQAAPSVVPLQALLAIAGLLCSALLVVSLFTLWQSHRTYLETVRLQQTIAEAHQTFLSQALQAAALPRPAVTRPAPAPPPRAAPAPPAPAPPAPAPAPAPEGTGTWAERFGELADVEFAVLEKLAVDPGFFTRHSLDEFGASQLTIDTLLYEGFAKLDGLGRATVPNDVQAALRTWRLPGRV